jgi:hypothetical protein
MAKELPYFKFEPNQWENGNIQMCSDIAKAHFINICSSYWSRTGSLSDRFAIAKCCSGNKSTFDELVENQIIKVSDEGSIIISFLDSQLSDFMDLKKARSESGKKGGQKGGVRPDVERIQGNQLYLLLCSGNNEQFLKLGTTSNCISRRYSGKMPYEYSVIFQLVTDDYLNLESEYCELFAKYEYKPKLNFQGQKECYSISFLSEIKAILEQRHSIAIAPLKRSEAIREDKRKEDEIRGEENPSIFEENFERAFDEITCDRYKNIFKEVDLGRELQLFRVKCDNDKATYYSRDYAGLRTAFQYQLKTAEKNGNQNGIIKKEHPAEAAAINFAERHGIKDN